MEKVTYAKIGTAMILTIHEFPGINDYDLHKVITEETGLTLPQSHRILTAIVNTGIILKDGHKLTARKEQTS